jgi:hypothetical protein
MLERELMARGEHAAAALEDAICLKNNAFKVPLAKALVRRALRALVE